MAKRKILPGIEAVHDNEGIVFYCDGEPIEDMEFTWEDLEDAELVQEVAEEVVEYLEEDAADELDNPVAEVVRQVKRLRESHVGKKESAEEDDDFESEPEEEDDDEE